MYGEVHVGRAPSPAAVDFDWIRDSQKRQRRAGAPALHMNPGTRISS